MIVGGIVVILRLLSIFSNFSLVNEARPALSIPQALAAINILRQSPRYGRYSNGYINTSRQGKYYLFECVKEVGWKV